MKHKDKLIKPEFKQRKIVENIFHGMSLSWRKLRKKAIYGCSTIIISTDQWVSVRSKDWQFKVHLITVGQMCLKVKLIWIQQQWIQLITVEDKYLKVKLKRMKHQSKLKNRQKLIQKKWIKRCLHLQNEHFIKRSICWQMLTRINESIVLRSIIEIWWLKFYINDC
jgi:hypothetical protein